MSEYLSDKEQIELIKKWWKDYGMSVLIAVIVGLSVGFGWRYWQQHKLQNESTASEMFQEALFSNEKGDVTSAAQNAKTLTEKFPASPYAALANLLVAKDAVTNNNLPFALEKLNSTIMNTRDARFRQIARLRAARILLAQKQFASGLTMLATVEDKTFTPIIEQIRGDIYSAQGKKELAEKEYNSAKKGFDNAGLQDPFLQMKIAG